MENILRNLRYIVPYLFHQLAAIGTFWWCAIVVISAIIALLLAHLYYREHLHLREAIVYQFLAMYVCVVLTSTVFARDVLMLDSNGMMQNVNLDLFGTILRRLTGPGNLVLEILLNVLLFVPFGFLLPASDITPNMSLTIRTAAVLTLIIEVLQLVTSRGTFELSDIVENILGAIAGYSLWVVSHKLWQILSLKMA